MPAKRTPKAESSGGSARLVRRLIVVALTLAVGVGVVWGVARLGEEARRGIGSRDRYAVHFASIECDSPPGLERVAFLSEVRYVANFPESFQSLDPELNAKLTAAFAAHPWVAGVEDVSVTTDRVVQVKLRFRVPVLAVHPQNGTVRLVDSAGVLLPPEASPDGTAELTSPVATSLPLAGQVWPDADVKRAVELVESHHPRRLEKTPQGWRLTTADGKTLVLER
ncbi:MAG: hypothetical protein K8U57_06275 [Planctomycetes bacterium]|nr:hypothetical protein [Planctomycetota bacterium]